jgi:cytoskeleton protein RodZ
MTMAEEHQADFGTFLRRAREQRGVSLQDVAVTTKISARVLEALERNDPSKLPGGIFSRAFVRSYAREVGLDPDIVVAKFVAAFPDESGADEMPSTTSAVEAESFEQRRRVVKVLVRLLGVALLVGVVAVAYYVWLGRRPAASTADVSRPTAAAPAPQVPVASNVQPPEPGPEASVQPGGAPSQTDAAPGVAAAPGTGQAGPAAPPAAQPVSAAEQAAAPAAPPVTDSSQQAPLLVVLAVSAPCWLSVSVDGTRSPSRTVGAGERLEFPVQRSITMTAGNAGAVSLTLNGRPARALGAAGEVVTATITAAGYESFLR